MQLPLAWSLARRLRRRQREREALLRRAIDASDAERRRIAGDLHDGVVQDLAGVSYAAGRGRRRLDGRPAEAVGGCRRGAAAARASSVRALRALLVEIYPPSLQRVRAGAAAVRPARAASARGIDGRGRRRRVDLALAAETEALIFRGAQEALRNVAQARGCRPASR